MLRQNCCICRLSGAVVTDRAGVQPRPQPKPGDHWLGPAVIQPYV